MHWLRTNLSLFLIILSALSYSDKPSFPNSTIASSAYEQANPCQNQIKLHAAVSSSAISQNYQPSHTPEQLKNQIVLSYLKANMTPSQFMEFCRQQHMKAFGVDTVLLKVLTTGCIEYSLENRLTGFSFTKTEFPTHWDYKKLIQNCWDVYENPLSTEIAIPGNKIIKTGTVDNCKIELILKRHPNTDNIITAYHPAKKQIG